MIVRKGEKGAVALFIVIFSALLITTITVAFVRIMIQDQQQATTNDLSKSALDSAFAGVEDAKRAIIKYKSQCVGQGSESGSDMCNKLEAALKDGSQCNTLQQAGIVGDPDPSEGGWLIQQNEGDRLLKQAYTCVKVKLDTDDFVGTVSPHASRFIPLRSQDGKSFKQVKIEWFSQKDLQGSTTVGSLGSEAKIDLDSETKLPKLSSATWPKNRPPLLRVQLIQFDKDNGFKLTDFDKDSDGKSNNASLFLRPIAGSADSDNPTKFSYDFRQSANSLALQPIACNQDFTTTSEGRYYACSTTIELPEPINSDNGNNRVAFLRVNELYNPNTDFRVSLWDTSSLIPFGSVQPLIDSTGRANDLFRRIQSRIELDGSIIPGVEAAVDLTGSLCKAFLVTDTTYEPGTCSGN